MKIDEFTFLRNNNFWCQTNIPKKKFACLSYTKTKPPFLIFLWSTLKLKWPWPRVCVSCFFEKPPIFISHSKSKQKFSCVSFAEKPFFSPQFYIYFLGMSGSKNSLSFFLVYLFIRRIFFCVGVLSDIKISKASYILLLVSLSYPLKPFFFDYQNKTSFKLLTKIKFNS